MAVQHYPGRKERQRQQRGDHAHAHIGPARYRTSSFDLFQLHRRSSSPSCPSEVRSSRPPPSRVTRRSPRGITGPPEWVIYRGLPLPEVTAPTTDATTRRASITPSASPAASARVESMTRYDNANQPTPTTTMAAAPMTAPRPGRELAAPAH